MFFAKDVLATVLICMGILLIVYREHKSEMSRQNVAVENCEAKGGTYFVTEHKCLAIKEIK